MHCMDCGKKLEQLHYSQTSEKYHCKNCNAHWFRTNVVRVEWSKKKITDE
jgi:DNA-directed RNA polymerase subunit RPC12/RpoP